MDKILKLLIALSMPFQLTALCITANCDDHTVSLIDTDKWTITHTLDVGKNPRELVWDQAAHTLFVSNSGDNTLSCIDLSNYTITSISLPSEPRGMALNGRSLYVILKNRDQACVIDADTLKIQKNYTTGKGPRNIVLSKDNFFTSNNGEDTISTAHTTIQAPAQPYGLYLNDSILYVTSIGNNCVALYDTTTMQKIYTIQVPSHPTALALHPFKPLLYCTSLDEDKVCVIDLTSKSVQEEISVGKNPFGLALSPDGRYLTVTNNGHDTLSVIDTDLNQVVHTLSIGKNPHGVLWIDAK